MSEYINKNIINNKLIPLYKELSFIHPKQAKGVMMAIKRLEEQPTADVEEVRHGKWVKDKSKNRDDGEIYDYCCSRCCGLAGKNDYNNYSILSAYCPHCGAKMDGE